jgi:hypothetical protein
LLFQPKTATELIGSCAAVRELTCPEGVDEVAGTKTIDFMLESLEQWIPQAFSCCFFERQQVQRKIAALHFR